MADPNRSINIKSDKYSKRDMEEKEDGEVDDDSMDSDEDQRGNKKSNLPVYCICRSTKADGFMIGCDNCEEWYHGDCISITEVDAKKIKKYFCLLCIERNPSLEIVYKEKKGGRKKATVTSEPVSHQSTVVSKPLEEVNRDRGYYGDDDYEPVARKKRYFPSDDSDEDSDHRRKPSKVKKTSSSQAKGRSGGKPTNTGRSVGRKPKESRHDERRRGKQNSESKRGRKTRTSLDQASDGPKQCYGPGCIEVARKGSKYCSEKCGLKLAENRILEILPQRIREWQEHPSVADELSSQGLDKIRHEQQEARKMLEELEKRTQDLDDMIETAKRTVVPFTEEEEEEYEDQQEPEDDHSTYCVTCGHEVNNRVAMRHMERCFNKYESQTSLGSVYKTKIDNLFCDSYNPHQKTYCKRLRVLCPEHSKDPKIGDDEVCGYPLVSNVFNETGSFCRVLKKKCSKHHGWEKMRRALIDMERVQQWLRIDDLFEREQKTRFAMANRGGVLALMLHKTILASDDTHM